jgi:two-component system, OmpR family, lantibiotic biosynthesis response regulator NisR/SpaR
VNSHAPKEPLRILVVEDDRVTYSALTILLRHYHYDVTLARTLAEGKRELERQDPDLVILDLMLPDGNGLEVLEQIRETGRKTRVAVVTGSDMPETEKRLRRLRPDWYFRKPLNFIELLQGIQGEQGTGDDTRDGQLPVV